MRAALLRLTSADSPESKMSIKFFKVVKCSPSIFVSMCRFITLNKKLKCSKLECFNTKIYVFFRHNQKVKCKVFEVTRILQRVFKLNSSFVLDETYETSANIQIKTKQIP
jgi:hypothetical protein